MTILILGEMDGANISAATLRVITAASQIGGDADLLLTGADPGPLAGRTLAMPGVRRVLVGAGLEHASAETLTELLAQLAPDYTHIMAAAGSVGRDVIPRLAARLDLMPITDIVAIAGPDRFERPIYAGNAIETLTNTQAKGLLTVRASAFAPMAGTGSAPVERVGMEPPVPLASVLGAKRSAGDGPDLSTAKVVVGGGVALGSAENFALITALAQELGAAVGATRAAVDAGYAPNDWQVGQTGKAIAPDLYIAVGISGALQHLAGIAGAKTIVAINKDPEAPIMALADYRLVGDLFEIVPQLTAALKARQ